MGAGCGARIGVRRRRFFRGDGGRRRGGVRSVDLRAERLAAFLGPGGGFEARAAFGLCACACSFLIGSHALHGLRVEKLGNSSVRYGIGLFRSGEEAPAAEGWFVHVFVDREARRSTPIPDRIRAALAPLVVEPAP